MFNIVQTNSVKDMKMRYAPIVEGNRITEAEATVVTQFNQGVSGKRVVFRFLGPFFVADPDAYRDTFLFAQKSKRRIFIKC